MTGGVLYLTQTNALAQSMREHIPTEKVLETSLMGLVDSAQRVRDRNDYLIAEIIDLKNKIQNLHEEVKAMALMKSQLTSNTNEDDGIIDAQKQKTKLSQLSLDRLVTELDNFSRENDALEQKVATQKESERDLALQIAELERNVQQLKEQEHQLSVSLTDNPLETEKWKASKALDKATEDLMRVQKEYDAHQRKVSKPQDELSTLKMNNEDLKQQIAILHESQGNLSEEAKEIKGEILKIEKDFQKESIRISQQIKELNKRQKGVQSLLAEAQARLDGKDLETGYSEQVEVQLKADLNLIKQENRSLKQETVLLEQTLEKISASQ